MMGAYYILPRVIGNFLAVFLCLYIIFPAHALIPQEVEVNKTAVLMGQLEQSLIKALSEQGVRGNLRVELIGEEQEIFKAFYYGNADLQQVQVSNINTNNGYFSARVKILPHSAKHSVTVQLQGQYDDVVQVPVLSHKVSKGTVITKEDITLIERSARLVKGDVITRIGDLEGKMAKGTIFPDKPVLARVVSQPILIKKGRYVTLVYDTPAIHLRTMGIALEEGEQNALIPVKNVASGVVVHAEVSGPNEARIPVIGSEGEKYGN